MNCLWIGLIGIYVNLMVFLLTDFSLWYFFGLIAFICMFVCATNKRQRHK